MIYFYKCFVNLLFIISLPVLPLICFFSEKRRSNLFLRFGFQSDFKPKKKSEKRIWIHALSVGEVNSVVPFIKELKKSYQGLNIIFTTTTRTGQETAKRLLMDDSGKLIDQLGYFPFDLGWSIRKIAGQIEPDSVIIVESDLWPNFLFEMEKMAVPVILINARLSKRSLKGYQKFKFIFKPLFSVFKKIMLQSRIDEKRFQKIGIKPDLLTVTGNMKFDLDLNSNNKDQSIINRERLGIRASDFIWIAGSTHEGEDEILFDVFQNLMKTKSDLKLIVAPRDPLRAGSLVKLCRRFGLTAKLFSEIELNESESQVLLLDRMGELAKLYAVCDMAFIGGSLVCQGGHNPLEAAVFSKPIVFGPDMSDFLDISRLLIENKGAYQVDDKKDLLNRVETLIKDRELRQEMGQNNYNIVCQHAGSVKKILNQMEMLRLV